MRVRENRRYMVKFLRFVTRVRGDHALQELRAVRALIFGNASAKNRPKF